MKVLYPGAANGEAAVVMEEAVDEEDGKDVDVAGVNWENAGVSDSGAEKKKMKKQRRRWKRQKPCGASPYVDIASLTKHELILGHLELKEEIKVLQGSNEVQHQQLALLRDQTACNSGTGCTVTEEQ